MKDLTKKENWDESLKYVAKSRLIIGLIFGFLLGLYTRLFFLEARKRQRGYLLNNDYLL